MASVMRDPNSDIVASGGTADPNTLKATITVAFAGNASSTISQSQLLIHNAYSN